MIPALAAHFGRPERLPLQVERVNETVLGGIAHRKNSGAGNGDAGKAVPDARSLPSERRSVGWPLRQKSLVRRNAVPMRAPPLWPISTFPEAHADGQKGQVEDK